VIGLKKHFFESKVCCIVKVFWARPGYAGAWSLTIQLRFKDVATRDEFLKSWGVLARYVRDYEPFCLLFAAIQRGPVVVSIAAAARLQLVGSQPCSVAMCVVCDGDPSTNYSSKHCRGRWVANITRRCAFEIMHNH